MVSVLTLRNDSEGRYIKISLRSPNSDVSTTISSVYLEPNGDLNAINPEIFDADILGGDLNDAPTNLTRYGVYHLKGINFVKSININKKISDHEILIGQAKANILKNERFTLIEINDKKKTIENEIIMKEGVIKGNLELINPKKTLKIDNYAMNIQNMEIYEDFDKLKELINNEYKEQYNRVEKIIRTGTIDKEGWYKINKLFEEAKKTEIYTKDYMSDDIINYYKELYGNNPLRKIMNHEELKVKISRILDIMNQNTNEKNKIWPPSSTA